MPLVGVEAQLDAIARDLCRREGCGQFDDTSYRDHVALIDAADDADRGGEFAAAIAMSRLRATWALRRSEAETKAALAPVLELLPIGHPAREDAIGASVRCHPGLGKSYARSD